MRMVPLFPYVRAELYRLPKLNIVTGNILFYTISKSLVRVQCTLIATDRKCFMTQNNIANVTYVNDFWTWIVWSVYKVTKAHIFIHFMFAWKRRKQNRIKSFCNASHAVTKILVGKAFVWMSTNILYLIWMLYFTQFQSFYLIINDEPYWMCLFFLLYSCLITLGFKAIILFGRHDFWI